jgi:hypothetical protein
MVSFVDPNAVPAFNALRHGKLLTIVANQNNLVFELPDTSLALTRLIDCVKAHQPTAQARTSENPFGDGESNVPENRPSNESAPEHSAPEHSALDRAAVRRLLDNAGLGSVSVMTDNDRRKQFSAWDFAWKGEDYLGAIQVVNRQGKTLNEVTTELLAADSQGCNDKFASGAREESGSTSDRIRRLFTSCKGPVVDVYVLYVVSTNDNGTFTVVATMGRSTSLNKIEEADKAVGTILAKGPGAEHAEEPSTTRTQPPSN